MSIKLSNDDRKNEIYTNNQTEQNQQTQIIKEDYLNDLKTEFYTREGLWKLNVDCEYTRLQQFNNNQTSNDNNLNTITNNNEPVKISFNTNLLNELKNSSENFQSNTKTLSNRTKYQAEFILFNYLKDIYVYNYNNIRQPNKIDLIDKRTYKSLFSTCHDINTEAYAQNSNNLLIAVGFLKGEIHVYDAFRKEFSFFLNSNKALDKSRVTCIKWIPNSLNLFLVSYSSGNMYLFDVNYHTLNQQQNQTQNLSQTNTQSAQILPTFEPINQGYGYTIYKNVTQPAKNKESSSNSYTVTSNVDTTLTNPIIKWSIYDNKSRVSGINEFSFSPCGQYLALACQDGYLRVFNYNEMFLKCLMKSYFGALLCVCWSHDGNYIATGGEDDLITIYSFNENRVACRCRGHYSWINSVSFDYWTYQDSVEETLNSNNLNIREDSDLEETHLTNQQSQAKYKIISPRNKRYSSISDHWESSNRKHCTFYRLGSVGQDNQVAFWDLTEDILKEKQTRFRANSSLSPPTFHVEESSDEMNQPQKKLSLKLSNDESNSSGSNSGGGFFKKHKRNSSLNAMKQMLPLRTNSSTNQVNLIKDNALKIDDKFSRMTTNQLCPKLDEVPLIEPLILKKISSERLSSIVFKEDCMITASQDGIISTWMRPGRLKSQISQSILSESNLNSTCL